MVDHEDTKTWTKRYVVKNRRECLFFLQEINCLVIRYIEEENYMAAVAGLDSLLNGLIPMSNSKKFGDLQPYLSSLSCVEGELLAFGDPARFKSEANGYGVGTSRSVEQIARSSRETAILAFEDARDFTDIAAAKAFVTPIIDALKSGMSADEVRRRYVPDFPRELREVLLEVDLRFFMPQINACVSKEHAAVSASRPKAERPKETRQERPAERVRAERAAPRAAKEPQVSRPKPVRLTKRQMRNLDFEEWMENVGLDEEDLETIYQTARFRRNLFFFLTFFTGPLGILFAPFWGWAMYLTKAVRYRDFDASPNILAQFACGIMYIGGLIVYPILILWVVLPLTGWCLRPDQKDRFVPLWTLVGLILLGLAVTSVIRAIVIGAVLVAYWCWRKGTAVPAIVLAVLAAVWLVAWLFFGMAPDQAAGRLSGGKTPAEPAAEGLAGSWYSIELYNPEQGVLEPDYLTLRCYSFGEDGVCDTMSRTYKKTDTAESDFAAFDHNWQLEYEERCLQSYALDEEAGWLSLCLEGAPGGHEFNNSEYERVYTYELRDGALYMGWDGLTAYLRTETELDNAESILTSFYLQNRKLAGSWTTAWREEDSIWTETYTFFENGFFELQPCGYDNVAYTQFPDESGWYVMPMGHPATYGTYFFDGNTLALTYLGCYVIPPEEWEAAVCTLPVGGDLNRELEVDGTRYLADKDYRDLEALWVALGVDCSAG